MKLRLFFILFVHIATIISCTTDELNDKDIEEEVKNNAPNNFKVEVSNINFNSAKINWTKAIDPENDSVVYNVYLNQTLVANNVTELTYQFNNLTELCFYSGKIVAIDQKNNKTEVDFSFYTPKYYLKYLKKYDFGPAEYGTIGYSSGQPYRMIKTNDQNYIIAGKAGFPNGNGYRFFVLKIDYEGNTIWKKFYDYQVGDGSNFKIINSSTGYLLVGSWNVLSLSNDGDVIWYKKINSYDTSSVGYAEIKSVAVDAHGDIYLVGNKDFPFQVGNLKGKGMITKLSSNGEIIWNKIYENLFHDIVINSSNELIILGLWQTDKESKYSLLKTNKEGNIIWKNTYGDGGFPRQLIVRKNGNFVFTVSYVGPAEGGIYEVNPDGLELWRNSNGLSECKSVDETLDGSLIATGYVDFGNYGALGIYKFSNKGLELWNKKYQQEFTTIWGDSILAENDGGYRIAGHSFKYHYYGTEKPELLIFKTDPDGNFE